MGYTTDFDGAISVTPPMSEELTTFLTKFSETRRMHRTKGPHFVDGTGMMGQGQDDDILNYNEPDPSQPGLWCQWTPDGDDKIVWDGGEKFYHSPEWMAYIITEFLEPAGHTCDGVIYAQGEENSDRWCLIVTDNKVQVRES
jgi:hypothetical protein